MSGPCGASRFELPVALGKDCFLATVKLVEWRHVTDHAVQPNLVVLGDVLGNETPRVL